MVHQNNRDAYIQRFHTSKSEAKGGRKTIHNKGYYLACTLTLLIAITIVGLLQLKKPITNVSAVEAPQNIGVYWDFKCTNRVNSIDWGTLTPGQTKKTAIYIRNEGNTSILLDLSTANYNPPNASNYISFGWSCSDNKLEANESIQIIQNLQISPKIKDIYKFNFDIIFKAETYTRGDINKDGRIDIYDTLLFALAYGSTPQEKRWNPDADLNRDGIITILDAIALVSHFQ